MHAATAQVRPGRPSGTCAPRVGRPGHRRGAILIYVLGILTLLALVGLILIARTHGESKHVANEATASSSQAAINGALRLIQETLHRDIWGPAGQALSPLSSAPAVGLQETNEPIDAPGPDDRWLASNLPYYVGRQTANTFPAPTLEEEVLAYYRVSYLGTDVIRSEVPQNPAGLPRADLFAWIVNRRTHDPAAGLIIETSYNDSSLQDVSILQTSAPHAVDAAGNPLPMIPGSNTNLTIAEGHAIWKNVDEPAFRSVGAVRRFPYFDTNADGQVDLYDADGDGVPDSPISFVLNQDSADPDAPNQLYAVIRIVDNAARLNANVAFSLQLTNGDLTFNEAASGLQRRGRRTTELLLDEVTHTDDTFAAPAGSDRAAGLVAFRWNNPSAPDPRLYDADVVRRQLVGGRPPVPSYALYGPTDEASLRHRGILAPHVFANYDKSTFTADYRTIDRALRWSLLWTRTVNPATSSYLANASRWNRLNANYEPFGATTTYEGYDDAAGLGWRTLFQEDDPAAVRRPMFTTVSHAVVPPPDILTQIDGFPAISSLPGERPIDFRLRQFWAMGMSWPVILPSASSPVTDPNRPTEPTLTDSFILPTAAPLMPEWTRVQAIDLNMSDPADPDAARLDFIRYTAAAMFLALDGVDSCQGIPLSVNMNPQAPLNREWLAWQFAANLADYRDSDGVPTTLQWFPDPATGQSRTIFGIEKQPFLTEAFTYLVAGAQGPGGSNLPDRQDKWFFAVELFVPPLWIVPATNLYFRSPGVPTLGLLPLSQFLQGGAGQAPILDGGPDGRYFVFCGDITHVPADLKIPQAPNNVTTFYQNPAFKIATDGLGSVELIYSPDGTETHPATHALDLIGPNYSGGAPGGGGSSGTGRWAKRDPTVPEGTHREFSLLRSTKGWRFTTAWHAYTEGGPGGSNLPGPPHQPSLGTYNDTAGTLDRTIPESIWPTLVTLATPDHEPLFPDVSGGIAVGFASGLPHEAFDSVAEISRLMMIGPARFTTAQPLLPALTAYGTSSNRDFLPATAFIAEILDAGGTGDLPLAIEDRVAAGRIDFVDAKHVGAGSRRGPWTWRLFDYLTTQGHLFDGVDNDGDDPGDGTATDLNDLDEGATVLYRLAGRINVNTAPAAVLRAVPHMSLLPTSVEYTRHGNAGTPVANPAAKFLASADPGSEYWDFATAIVARREDRRVPLRLFDIATGRLLEVAAARPRSAGGPGPGGGGPALVDTGPFHGLAELAALANRLNQSPAIIDEFGNNSLFHLDRFRANPNIALWNHRLPPPNAYGPDLGGSDPFSPDYRYRHDGGLMDYVPITLPAQTAGNPADAGGIRGRDVFLTRWTSLLSTRSDVFTAYVALLDEDGNTVRRTQVTLDRSDCFREVPTFGPGARRIPVLPTVLGRADSSYTDDTR